MRSSWLYKKADVVAAWLATRFRFSTANFPDGTIQPFDRGCSWIHPKRGSLVAVRGLESGRRWLRKLGLDEPAWRTGLPLADDWSVEPTLLGDLSTEDREALLAFWRSLDATDPIAANIALFDCLNFYVEGTKLPRQFTKSELELLRKAPPDWLAENQRERYVQVIDQLNAPSLFSQLGVALERDGIKVTEAEWQLLRTLRKLRNPAQHGESRVAPRREDLRFGWAIVARILVHRLARVESALTR
jgi:hypothetical protein